MVISSFESFFVFPTGGSEERVCGSEEQEEHQFSDVEDSEDNDDNEDDDEEDESTTHDDPPSSCSSDTHPSTGGHSTSSKHSQQGNADQDRSHRPQSQFESRALPSRCVVRQQTRLLALQQEGALLPSGFQSSESVFPQQ